MISTLVRLPESGQTVVLDAGCGTGKAIVDLREAWLKRQPDLSVTLLGIESDKGRHQQAQELLSSIGGSALWSSIEDTWLEGSVSLLWFNPPYDKIRGAGRLEVSLFNQVKDWPARDQGLLVLIVPDNVLADADTALAVAVERDYELLGLWRYPEPEYAVFKQCVLIARRRPRALNKTNVLFPAWARKPENWPILSDDIRPVATLQAGQRLPKLWRSRLGNEIILDTVGRSPLRGSMLREATSTAPKVGRPLLPLKPGHLALALAGGLCDGIIEANGERFLVKGSLSSAVRKSATKDQLGPDGEKVAEIDVFRTHYEMNCRCLRNDGRLENYPSAKPEAESEVEDSNADENE